MQLGSDGFGVAARWPAVVAGLPVWLLSAGFFAVPAAAFSLAAAFQAWPVAPASAPWLAVVPTVWPEAAVVEPWSAAVFQALSVAPAWRARLFLPFSPAVR